jgi:hypothetical protein
LEDIRWNVFFGLKVSTQSVEPPTWSSFLPSFSCSYDMFTFSSKVTVKIWKMSKWISQSHFYAP